MAASESRVPISKVFVPGGMPTHTYNARLDLKLEARVRDYLLERHKVLSLSGPTKAGKTVLLKAALGDAIWISGGAIDTPDEFWDSICASLSVYTEFETSAELTDTGESSTTGGGGIKPFGVGGHIDHTKT